jgi:hypothetical protein
MVSRSVPGVQSGDLAPSGWVEECAHSAAGREPSLGEGALGLAAEEPYPNGEDHVEAALAEVDVLEALNEELGFPSLDEGCVARRSRLDHLHRPIDRGQVATLEPLADHRCGHTVATADLENPVIGAYAELIDDRPQSLVQAGHGRRSCSRLATTC